MYLFYKSLYQIIPNLNTPPRVILTTKIKEMKDKNGIEISIGDTISISGLETKVIKFSVVAGQSMIDTEYGSFNPEIIEVKNNHS